MAWTLNWLVDFRYWTNQISLLQIISLHCCYRFFPTVVKLSMYNREFEPRCSYGKHQAKKNLAYTFRQKNDIFAYTVLQMLYLSAWWVHEASWKTTRTLVIRKTYSWKKHWISHKKMNTAWNWTFRMTRYAFSNDALTLVMTFAIVWNDLLDNLIVAVFFAGFRDCRGFRRGMYIACDMNYPFFSRWVVIPSYSVVIPSYSVVIWQQKIIWRMIF